MEGSVSVDGLYRSGSDTNTLLLTESRIMAGNEVDEVSYNSTEMSEGEGV